MSFIYSNESHCGIIQYMLFSISDQIWTWSCAIFVPCSLPLPMFCQTTSNKSDNFSNNVWDPEAHVTHYWSCEVMQGPSAIHTNQTKACVTHSLPDYTQTCLQFLSEQETPLYLGLYQVLVFFGSNEDMNNEEPEPTPEPPPQVHPTAPGHHFSC